MNERNTSEVLGECMRALARDIALHAGEIAKLRLNKRVLNAPIERQAQRD